LTKRTLVHLLANLHRFLLPAAILAGLFGLAAKTWAATGDITAVRILGTTCTAAAPACDGWVAEIDMAGFNTGGAYNFGLTSSPASLAGARLVFTVSGPGYDASGNATTVTRTVYGTQYVRKPYPASTTNAYNNNPGGGVLVKDETVNAGTLTVRVALSDYIYAGDTATANIAAGFYTDSATPNNACNNCVPVTNNSAITYPSPIGRWVTPAFQAVGSPLTVEATVFHRFGLSAVVFACADAHAHSVTSTVNNLSVSATPGDQHAVLVYAAAINTSAMTQGDIVTCNFTAYPKIGNVTLTSDNGITPPDVRLCPLPMLLDKTGAYSAAFAVVDPANGRSSSAVTWTYSTQAAAEAAYAGDHTLSYKYIGYAAQACKAYNNASNGHNDPGGCTTLLAPASHAYPGIQPGEGGAQNTYLTITRLSTAAQSEVVINTNNGVGSFQTQKVKIAGVTLASSDATLPGRTTDVLWLDNNAIAMTGSNSIYRWQLAYATRNSITSFPLGFVYYSSYACPWALVRGNSAPSATAGPGVPVNVYAVVGNSNLVPLTGNSGYVASGNPASQQTSDNSVLAFNTFLNINTQMAGAASTTSFLAGAAIVQNVWEKVTTVSPILQFAADASTSDPVDNVLVWHNTFAGERSNLVYNDSGTAARRRRNWSVRYNVFANLNMKTETFGTPSGARVGNWGPSYGAGFAGNHLYTGATTVFFEPDYDGLFSQSNTGQGATAYVNNAAYGEGTAAGNGDYHPTASSSGLRNQVPAGWQVLPYDLDGLARSNTGAGAIGAYEYPSTRRRVVITE
jgi:hypothetical protein